MLKKKIIKFICFFIFNKKKRKIARSKLFFKYGINSEAYNNYYSSVKLKHSELYNNPKKWNTLILGDSHALHSVCSFLINENTFNYAFDNNGFYETLKSLEKVIDKCSNLKRVILTASFFNGSTKQIKQSLAWHCRFLYNLININYDFSENTDADFELIDWFYNNAKLKNHICLQGFDFPSIYGKVNDTDKSYLIERIKKRIHLYEKYDNQWIYFEEICNLCRDNNIELILIDTPYRNDYIKYMLDFGYNIDDMCKKVYKIANKYNIKYHRIIDDFVDDDFHDADHLNFKGAIKYTRRLIDIIKE